MRDVLPWVWAHWQPGDLIGGDPRHGPLYPTAPESALWALVDAHYPQGYDYRTRPDALEDGLRRLARERWPRADWLTFSRDGETYPKPTIPLPDPYVVDVAMAPRTKPYTDAKNGWPWADLARACRDRGWTVGVVGSRAESAEVPCDIAAWDLDPAGDRITGTLRLLRGARIVVTLDSGIGHLASLVDSPQVVIYPRRGDEHRELPLRDGVPAAMRFADMHRWNRALCLLAWGGMPDVLATIDEVLTRLRVVSGSIAARKGLPVSLVPGWRPGETMVLKEADQSLIMRPGGHELITCRDPNPASAPTSFTPRLAEPDVQATRRILCAVCRHHHAGGCSIAGCSCAGLGRPEHQFSRCPIGTW